jgi:hypothetical protein
MSASKRTRNLPMTQHRRDWQVTKKYTRAAWLLLLAAMVTAQAARADDPERCAAIDDDRARLACYDSLFGRPTAPPPAGAAAVVAPASASAAGGTAVSAPAAAPPAVSAPTGAAANPAADFGLTEAAKRARESQESGQKPPESISGTVAKVGRQPAGELIVTLESGQVWTQVQVDTRARIAAGDTVTIKKAALGSYLLVTAGRYATRVRRVK